MSKLVIRRSDSINVTPATAAWWYVGFEVRSLSRGESVERSTGERELCAVFLSGTADVGSATQRWADVGSRNSVFRGTPDAVYLPPNDRLKVTARSDVCEVAFCWAPAREGALPSLIKASDVKAFQRGLGRAERTIHNILMEDRPAESLLVTEVLTPGGNWSSYPPHKHDTDNPPSEAYLEEIYYHRTARPEGFAVQLVYTDDRSLDEAIQVGDGDVVLVPRGYHPVAAAPGYDLYYLNVMAGPRRQWLVTTDPAHRWQLD